MVGILDEDLIRLMKTTIGFGTQGMNIRQAIMDLYIEGDEYDDNEAKLA
jgi:hypothetical protein